MSIGDTVANLRLEYTRLHQLMEKYSSTSKPLPVFVTHYEYINSLATSILILSEKPKENVIALSSLLRMLLESVGVLYELVNGNTTHEDRVSFIRSYNRGEQYPKSMSYRKLVSRLPSTNKDSHKMLQKLYDECSKATHFSKKSLDILYDIDDPTIAVQWSEMLIMLVCDSYKQQSDAIEQLVSAKMQGKG